METEFLQIEFLSNTLLDYSWFIGAILVGLLFKKLISKYLSHLLFKIVGKKGAEVGVDKFDALLTKPIGFIIMLSIIYLGSSHINYPEVWNLAPENEVGLKMLINKGFSLIYVYSIFWIFLKVIDFIGLILNKRAEATENKMDDQLIPFIIEIAKILTYAFALIIVMGNIFEVNITALATGLGIGGLALAMASKESLENLLGSFTIFFDRPFTVGDIVTVGSVTGLVEKPSQDEAPSNLASIGRYILTSDIFDSLRTLPIGSGGEIQLADALNLHAQGGLLEAIELRGKRFDCGAIDGFINAAAHEYSKRKSKSACCRG